MYYRVYKLNPAGRIVSGQWIEADDEAEACARAQALCDPGAPQVELWQGARQLAILPHREDKAA